MTTTMTATNAVQGTTQQRPWWLTLCNGILALVIGGVLLWSPAKTQVETYLLLVTFLGFYWMIEGIFAVFSIFIDSTLWGWKLFLGLISIWAGGYIVMFPVAAGIGLPRLYVMLLGIWGFIYGLSLLFMAFRGAGWGAGILGALGIIFGSSLMFNYYLLGMGMTMLWFAAWSAVLGGIAMIFQAFSQRSA